MGNSLDLAPMDYGINGIFKFVKETNFLLNFKRVMKSVWSGLSQELIDNTLKLWPKRVRLMIESGGLHVDCMLNGGKHIFYMEKLVSKVDLCSYPALCRTGIRTTEYRQPLDTYIPLLVMVMLGRKESRSSDLGK